MSKQADVTPKAIAMRLGISDKRLRGFIRSEHRNGRSLVKPVGQGNRYGMSASDAQRIITAFVKAHPGHKMPKAQAPRKAKATQATQAPASHAPEGNVEGTPEGTPEASA